MLLIRSVGHLMFEKVLTSQISVNGDICYFKLVDKASFSDNLSMVPRVNTIFKCVYSKSYSGLWNVLSINQ